MTKAIVRTVAAARLWTRPGALGAKGSLPTVAALCAVTPSVCRRPPGGFDGRVAGDRCRPAQSNSATDSITSLLSTTIEPHHRPAPRRVGPVPAGNWGSPLCLESGRQRAPARCSLASRASSPMQSCAGWAAQGECGRPGELWFPREARRSLGRLNDRAVDCADPERVATVATVRARSWLRKEIEPANPKARRTRSGF
jgi:hypothetical protein